MKFADVVLPLPLDGLFTYSIPDNIINSVEIGYRVIVPFGARKYYTAIIVSIHENKPNNYEVKPIDSVIDTFPLINFQQLKLWRWIASYYMCSIGEVYNAAVPARLKMESETFISLTHDKSTEANLTTIEQNIILFLDKKNNQKISDISKELKVKDILPYTHSLSFKGLVTIEDNVVERYKPKVETFVKLNTSLQDVERVIGSAQKQLELYRILVDEFNNSGKDSILRKDITKRTGCSSSVLAGLIAKNVLIEFQEEISRINQNFNFSRKAYPLSQYQKKAYDNINKVFENKNVCLLHGVTSSGKTEIYIHLILEQIKKGKQVLFLVPEIALTTQLTMRLQAVFGKDLGVYHSRINDNERAEIWLKMQSETPFKIVIGVRSSIFLPFKNLGLVIVDEEHEPGYKQMDPSPRYHARDTSIVIAHNFGAKVLLGSATPAIETYHNTEIGKYGIVSLSQRYADIEMPNIILENTKELRRKKIMKSLLTPLMIDEISTALENNKQIILFRNRRGFAPVLECKFCGWTPKCKNCDVALTYHKYQNQLKCHYCNATYRVVHQCPSCNENSVEQLGMGTEMLQDEVNRLFPDAVVERMDMDTTRGCNNYEEIIYNFQEGHTDILVGTQMLSKGLDFENVAIVGIVAADGLLNHPDFRSHERGFQLMMQTAGRAGRKGEQGKVIIQAADPEISLFAYLQANDYLSFYRLQMSERKFFNYPPYTKLITITFRHRYENIVDKGSANFANLLKQSLGDMVLGPNKPVISYIKRYHIREILLKLDSSIHHVRVRDLISSVTKEFRGIDNFRYINIQYDVDPV